MKDLSKNKKMVIMGTVVSVFALIGVITLIVLAVSGIRFLIQNNDKNEEFEEFILPVMMYDPVPFESIEYATDNFVLQSGILNMLLNEDVAKYPKDDSGRLIVPATDVEMSCAKLFGSSLTFNHQTVGDYEVSYVYNSQKNSYFIPIEGKSDFYTPQIFKVIQENDLYRLIVGYLPPSTIWDKANHIENTPVKYMEYQLTASGKTYYLSAIMNAAEEDLPQ